MSTPSEAAKLAQRFHETYERLAPNFGYKTREASAKPWADVPEQNKQLMIAVAKEIIDADRASRQPDPSKDEEITKLKEALQRLIKAVNTHLLCGRPEIKTVNDVIEGMREVARKMSKVCQPDAKDTERQFPMQHGPSIPWSLGAAIYAGYARLHGHSQSCERIAERGGFSWAEVELMWKLWEFREAFHSAMAAEQEKK